MIKICFLFLAVWFTLINAARIHHGQRIEAGNFILQAIGITGFIYLQFLI